MKPKGIKGGSLRDVLTSKITQLATTLASGASLASAVGSITGNIGSAMWSGAAGGIVAYLVMSLIRAAIRQNRVPADVGSTAIANIQREFPMVENPMRTRVQPSEHIAVEMPTGEIALGVRGRGTLEGGRMILSRLAAENPLLAKAFTGLSGGIRPPFCRVGSKRDLVDRILKLFPKDFNVYVEPFVGSGAVYWNKEPSPVEVINDLDKDLIAAYRRLKRITSRSTDATRFSTLEKMRDFYNREPDSELDKLIHYLLRACNTFGSKGIGKLYQTNNPIEKIKKIDDYQERLKNTVILSEDYKKVIRKYDSPSTFFYLDPPYENSKDLYTHGGFDHEELSNVLSGIKGKFLLSLNDSPRIRKIFKGFNIRGFTLKAKGALGVGAEPRKEVFISNYGLKGGIRRYRAPPSDNPPPMRRRLGALVDEEFDNPPPVADEDAATVEGEAEEEQYKKFKDEVMRGVSEYAGTRFVKLKTIKKALNSVDNELKQEFVDEIDNELELEGIEIRDDEPRKAPTIKEEDAVRSRFAAPALSTDWSTIGPKRNLKRR